MNPISPVRIHFLLCERMLATSSTLPMEMLMASESAARSLPSNEHQPPLDIKTISLTDSPVATRTGLLWQPDTIIDRKPASDLIYIPGLWRNPRPAVQKHKETLNWLREQYHNGAIISAVGTGVCFLAEAGLLDGKAATTHWHYFDQFQKDYPQIQLKRQYFITQAGNLYCAASVNSLADLTVHFIHRFFGKAIASHVERHFSHEIRQAYDTSGFFEAEQNPHPDEEITQIQIWLQDNYQRDILFPQVANRFSMSVRTLNRRFKNALGQTPLDYLQEIRINIAKDLLKTSNLSISEVADKVGYQDTGYFNALFKKKLATTPNAYRETVRAKLFST
ncbi:GlxA family transcriptional regulator [Cellvibrio sp. NN19]|uniref:GlxA family transcriptional regulator n=1 Tax=Cellvibrio chitinivorans TaxID=3102792 RepID=UPI002B40ED85|nr:helix-turn-helix domain-containing protein [Cellvibrio sp. NN19]